MCEALPVRILARRSARGAAVAQWAQQQRDAPLAEQDRAVVALVHAAVPDLLGAVVQLSVTALDRGVRGVRRRCTSCGHRPRVPRWPVRQVRSIGGALRIRRPW